ncbi:DUF5412 domain-containing protein [Paenibacillus aceris]|uniref:DUF5412 domain-containing protein n=1 Tax=Paenibacillus aceris TaxID=869555 RepID=A0ABS4I471_9BACL|nr:DUF5412 domain-containing protein [Paenibacillus aceris]MBP1965699.1 hypothetical protein [Paenibacillus aceris]NHW36411.1 DUF5412 domain-containing protein [Paenibacillus aceris]
MKFNKKLKYVLLPITLVACLIGYGWYWAFYDLNRLSGGEFILQTTSPNGTYTIKAYLSNGGATTDFAVRGQLIFNKSSSKPQNVYWNYGEDTADINWVDDDTVNINGHILNLPDDRYDFRRH